MYRTYVTIKICGFTRPQDVDLAVRAGADAIGLVLVDDGSPCRVDVGRARELLAAAGDAETVAVLGPATPAGLEAVAPLGFDVLQVVVEPGVEGGSLLGHGAAGLLPVFFDHGEVEAAVAGWVAGHSLPPVRRGSVVGTVNLDGALGGGQGLRADWTRAAKLARRWPLTLSGGLNLENVAAALERVRPHAVDVTSGTEASPGVKDPVRLRDFIEAVRA